MTSIFRNYSKQALGIALLFCTMTVARLFAEKYKDNPITQTPAPITKMNDTTVKVKLQGIVKGILAVWDTADVVCLGEGHGDKNDSHLRIALVEHPDFVRKVNVIIVEFANIAHQDILDRFVLDGEDLPREKLRVVWSDANSADVWEFPIYEAFLRAVRKVNLTVLRDKRVRLIGGDNPKEQNRGRFIRERVSREILSKGLKGLAIYGAGHCECRGGGFPGELEDKHPGKIWSAFSFYSEEGVREGRRLFNLGNEPKLIRITGTDKAKIPVGKMFFRGWYNDPATLGEIVNAIIYYGDIK
ncbi:MAG: ChaN family lipoprotein [Bacteroidota bacterium]|nr:ChaN family lipoprotein [Bacteroidota bacterium]